MTPNNNADDIVIRPMQLDDLDGVMEIERASFRNPWTPDVFITDWVNSKSRQRVAILRGEDNIAGYIIYWISEAQGHLMNVAVRPELTRRKIATGLLETMFAECRTVNVERITLEVRVDNEAAIGLYRKLGFDPAGLLEDYYRGGQDALIMELHIR